MRPARDPFVTRPTADGRTSIAPRRVRALVRRLAACLPSLSDRARGLLRDRAGLDGSTPATLTHLAARRGTSSAVVATQIRRAVRSLRRAARAGRCESSGAQPHGAPATASADGTDGGAGDSTTAGGTRSGGGRLDVAALDDGRRFASAASIAEVQAPSTTRGFPVLLELPGGKWPTLIFWVVVETGVVLLLIAGSMALVDARLTPVKTRFRQGGSRRLAPRRRRR